MDRNDIIEIFNGMCERYLLKGMVHSLGEAKELCDIFERFKNKKYINDEEYSNDIMYFYILCKKLHDSGHLSLEESYSTYNAILHADNVDYVESDYTENVILEEIEQSDDEKNTVEPVKIKRSRKQKTNDSVIDMSDISV